MRQIVPTIWAYIAIVFLAVALEASLAKAAPYCEAVFSIVRKNPNRFHPAALKTSESLYSKYSYKVIREKDRPLEFISAAKEKINRIGKSRYKEGDFHHEYAEEASDRLDIDGLIDDFDLTRVQAVELQAILRRYYKHATDDQFLKVVESVRRGVSLSGTKYENLKKARFIVAIDVDGTLLDQETQKFKSKPSIHDYLFSYGDGFHAVTMAPGWKDFLKGIKALGGSVVLYSRNSDRLIQEMFHHIQIDGVPVSEYVDAIYSSGHMVLTFESLEHLEFLQPSDLVKKDLRILDLKKTIIIDDNPDYVLQLGALRKVLQFDAKKLDPNFWSPRKSESVELSGEYAIDYSNDNAIDFASEQTASYETGYGFPTSANPNNQRFRSQRNKDITPIVDPIAAVRKETEKFNRQFRKILGEIGIALLDESFEKTSSFSASYRRFAIRSQQETKKGDQR